MDDYGFDVPMQAPVFTEFASGTFDDFGYGYGGDVFATDFMGPAPDFMGPVFDDAGSVPFAAPTFQPTSAMVETPTAPASDFFSSANFASIADKVSSLVVAAVRINNAYRASNNPPVQPGLQTTPNGTAQTARSDGTLATVDPATGRTIITRPANGVPYLTSDGGVVINNGNGTYTRVAPTGAASTHQYAAAVPPLGQAAYSSEWVPGIPNVALLGAGAVFALLLAKR